MDCDLLLQKSVERAMHQRATDCLSRLLESLKYLLDMVTARNTQELQDGLVVLKGEHCLVAWWKLVYLPSR